LVDAMIENYNEYQKIWGSMSGENLQIIEGEARDLFHHLIYLAILGPGGGSYKDTYSYCTNIIILRSDKYSDILKNVKKLAYFKDKAELYQAEAYFDAYYTEEEPSWTDFLNFVFNRISEKPITETYTLSPKEWDPGNMFGLWKSPSEEETSSDTENQISSAEGGEETDPSDTEGKKVAVELFPGITVDIKVGTLSEEERKYDEYMAQFEAQHEVGDETEIPPMSQEEYDRWQEETDKQINEENREAEEQYQNWFASLPDAEAFCKVYLEFREQLVKPELRVHLKNVEKEVEMLLDAWLYNTGESPYALGDSYSLVSARLQNTTAHLMRELDRARRLK